MLFDFLPSLYYNFLQFSIFWICLWTSFPECHISLADFVLNLGIYTVKTDNMVIKHKCHQKQKNHNVALRRIYYATLI